MGEPFNRREIGYVLDGFYTPLTNISITIFTYLLIIE